MAKQRNYSVNDIKAWKFSKLSMPEEWVNHLGHITENFRMIITGKSGHGKTEYAMQLSKMLALHYGKVSYNSTEQGRSASFKDSFLRNQIDEITGGKWMMCDPSQRTFEPWFKRLQRPNSGRVIILDSIDYMKLTIDQYKQLHERFRHKSLIVIGWSDPMDINTKKIRYMCDIKVEVDNYKAEIASRFGGNKTWDVWPDRHRKKNGQLHIPTTTRVDKVRVEKYHDYKVLIYEDQAEQLTRATANELFITYPEAREIHELHEQWGGRWSREKEKEPSHAH